MDDRLLDVNEHGVLRVPFQIWLMLIILTRHWWLVFLTLVSMRAAGSVAALSGGMPWWPMAGQSLALLLLWAGLNRVPTAGRFPRILWHRGPLLVVVTVALNLCWTAWCLATSDDWQPRPELALVSLSFLDLVMVWGLHTSAHLRRVFAEFPSPPTPVKDGAA